MQKIIWDKNPKFVRIFQEQGRRHWAQYGDGHMNLGRITALDSLDQHLAWLQAETFPSLVDFNEQFLKLVVAQTAAPIAQHPSSIFTELRPLLLSLDSGSLRRVASCPYLLLDAGFADSQRWLSAVKHQVSDVPAQEMPRVSDFIPLRVLARVVFTFAWHMSRAQVRTARMILGMTERTAEVFNTLTLLQVAAIAEQYPYWIQPRWPQHRRMWRDLLSGALAGDGPLLENARMRGVQLLAADVRLASGYN
jgi:hypothetical protein